MQYQIHPDDERLAALAGADPEVAGDAGLHSHLSSCERCSVMVDELTHLRAFLLELPDLVPSRPLQLVPPLTEPAARGGMLGWLRGFAMPAMAAGAGMVLVGAIGLTGVVAGGMAAGGAQNYDASAGGDRAEGEPGEAVASAPPDPASTAPLADPDERGSNDGFAPLIQVSSPAPWLVLLVIGAGLLVGGLALRFAVRPRAG